VVHSDPYDTLIIGGGPAGLSASIYLARFHLSVLVVDSGFSRAASIPKTRNHPGFPDGIAGIDLLKRMRNQAAKYGVQYRRDEVVSLRKEQTLFTAATPNAKLLSKTVLLATGVLNHRPSMPDDIHDAALSRGLLRYCPVCDAYEVTDRRVAVIGTGERGVNEAEFLRSYTSDVSLIAPDTHDLNAKQRQRVAKAGIRLFDGPCLEFTLRGDAIQIALPSGLVAFATVYPALGSDIHSALAVQVGAAVSDEGCLEVDEHQRSTVPGLYAAGDVVLGLNQISHAVGEGAVASTAIRNDMAKTDPFLRRSDQAR
jgi:thioredoxin reductase (NADPH)